jgi:hypothetical protein
MSEPLTGKADFSTWDRQTLERFAREAADENAVLRADLRTALDAYHKLLAEMPPITTDK